MTEQIEQEAEGIEAEGVLDEIETEQPEKPEPEAEPRDEAAEAEARKYGWRPKEEFTRDPQGWVDASRFLELPSTEVKRLRDELKERDSGFEDRVRRMESANKMAMKRAMDQQKAQYEETLEKLRHQQRQAVEDGDTDAYDRLERQEQDMLKKPPQADFDEPEAPPKDPAAAYADKYTWINDPVIRQAAASVVDGAIRAGDLPPSADAKAQIEYANGKLPKYFPHMFPKETPKQRQRVDAGGIGAVSAGKGVNSLPAEARNAGKEFVEMGVYKSMDDYAKDYWAQENQS